MACIDCLCCKSMAVDLLKESGRSGLLLTPKPHWHDAACKAKGRQIKWQFYKSFQNDKRLLPIYTIPYAALTTHISTIGTYQGLIMPNGVVDLTAYLNSKIATPLTNSDIIYVRVWIKTCRAEQSKSEFVRVGNAIVTAPTGTWKRDLYENVTANSNITVVTPLPAVANLPAYLYVFRDGLQIDYTNGYATNATQIIVTPPPTGVENFEVYTWQP